jgi:ribokinase
VSQFDNIVAVVLGGSNTDFVVTGARPAKPGELVAGSGFTIGPGGKSRNVAQMMATYLGPGRVAFVGRTLAASGDFAELDRIFAEADTGADIMPRVYSLLAQVPIQALRRAGVVTDFVTQAPYDGTASGIAEIVVLDSGENMIYSVPGVNAQFAPDDMDRAAPLMAALAARGGGGVVPLALEIPIDTALRGAALAREHGLTVILDPGGINKAKQLNRGATGTIEQLLDQVDIVKPNEHEALLLTGVEVTDDDSAGRACEVFHDRHGTSQVIITAGSRGAWHWTDGRLAMHPAYRPPEVSDATGCGDQFMAILCSHLATDPTDMAAAMEHALVAAALQATRLGIQPVPRAEVLDHVARYRQQSA